MAGNASLSAPGKGILAYLSNPRLQVILIGMFAFFLYAPSLQYGYSLDDEFLTENKFVQQGLRGLPGVLTHGYHYGFNEANDLAYRPHILAMFTVERAIVGDDPYLHHIGNLFLFVLASMLLTLLLQHLFRDRQAFLPLLMAGLWVSLPVHTEVICSIKNREETLTLAYLALSLWVYLEYLDKRKLFLLVLSLGTFLLALLTKEHAITFLAIFPLTAWVFTNYSFKKIGLTAAFFLIPTAIYLVLRTIALDDLLIGRDIDVVTNSLAEVPDGKWRMGTLFLIQAKYLQLTLFPVELSWDYSYNQIPLAELGSLKSWLSLIVVLALAGFGIFGLLRKRAWGFGLIWFFLTMAVVSNLFFLMGTFMGERFLFTPSIGIVIFLVAGGYYFLVEIRGKENSPLPLILAIIFPALTIAYSVRTHLRQPVWKDKLSLFRSGVETSPNSAKTHLALASELIRLSETEPDGAQAGNMLKEASGELDKSLEIYPRYAKAWFLKGVAMFRMLEPRGAESAFRNAVQYQENYPEALNFLGVIRLNEGDLEGAENWLRKAVEADSERKYDRSWVNLGVIAATKGNFEEAIADFEMALAINPENQQAEGNLQKAREDLANPVSLPDTTLPHP